MRYILLIIIFASCATSTENAQSIVNAATHVAGSEKLNRSSVEFRFRDMEYGLRQYDGQYEMVRISKDTVNLIQDILTNEGFTRLINGSKVDVADSMKVKYGNSINSVLYFALLPYKLNDRAVIKELLGSEEVNNRSYDKVRVTFLADGGGQDHEDEFIYWIDQDNRHVDYLAYSYQTDGGGQRFRVAYNPREINGVRIVDYINFKPADEVDLGDIAKLYQSGELEEVSRIKLENVTIADYNAEESISE